MAESRTARDAARAPGCLRPSATATAAPSTHSYARVWELRKTALCVDREVAVGCVCASPCTVQSAGARCGASDERACVRALELVDEREALVLEDPDIFVCGQPFTLRAVGRVDCS